MWVGLQDSSFTHEIDLDEDIMLCKYLGSFFLIKVNADTVMEEKHSADKDVDLIRIELGSGIAYSSKHSSDIGIFTEHSSLN